MLVCLRVHGMQQLEAKYEDERRRCLQEIENIRKVSRGTKN